MRTPSLVIGRRRRRRCRQHELEQKGYYNIISCCWIKYQIHVTRLILFFPRRFSRSAREIKKWKTTVINNCSNDSIFSSPYEHVTDARYPPTVISARHSRIRDRLIWSVWPRSVRRKCADPSTYYANGIIITVIISCHENVGFGGPRETKRSAVRRYRNDLLLVHPLCCGLSAVFGGTIESCSELLKYAGDRTEERVRF